MTYIQKNLSDRIKDIPSYIWKRLTQIDELKGRWLAHTSLPKTAVARLKQSVLVTSTGASTRIEGSGLADEDVENLMRGLDMQQFADRDRQEVQGYFELLQNIFDSYEEMTFSESTIKHFHQKLLKYVEKDSHHRGEYKMLENKVQLVDIQGKSQGIIFDTTPVYLTPAEVQALVEWTKNALQDTQLHPLITISAFIVELLHIHPFQDGNGRLSRILTNLLLLQRGYTFMAYISHEKIIEDNKKDYYLVLRKSQQTFRSIHEDIIPWLDFFTQIVLIQAQKAASLLTADFTESSLSSIQLQVLRYLQQKNEASPKEISDGTGVTRITVSQAVNKLLRLNKIERIGEGRATRYRLLQINTT